MHFRVGLGTDFNNDGLPSFSLYGGQRKRERESMRNRERRQISTHRLQREAQRAMNEGAKAGETNFATR